jgi:polysaccharide export outer membrane protein
MNRQNRMTVLGVALLGMLLFLGLDLKPACAEGTATDMNSSTSFDVPLGPGDLLKISVYDNPDLALETRVSESGTITFPLIGEVHVGGLTPSGAEKLIGSRLQRGGFLKQAQVNVLVTQFQGQLVSVLGQVNRPGRYPIDGKRNLTDILALAGGASATGADTVDLIRTRNGKTTKTVVNIVEMVQQGALSQDLGLMGGDLIFVERAPMFYIYGEVQKPGSYRLEPNMTVLQALSTGGGLTPRGTERDVRIKRQMPDGKLETIKASQDESVQPNDVVYIQESLF